MDRMKLQHRAVLEMVEEYADYLKLNDGTQLEPVTDERHGHYQILRTGWKDGRFLHDCLLHIAIRSDGKIHLLCNRTELEVDYELMRRGVAFDDLVIAEYRGAPTARTNNMAEQNEEREAPVG